MSLFYKPKHHKKRFNIRWDIIHNVFNFIVDETIWYILWWGKFIWSIFQNLYTFGEWILRQAIKSIDWFDRFWDEVEDTLNGVMR